MAACSDDSDDSVVVEIDFTIPATPQMGAHWRLFSISISTYYYHRDKGGSSPAAEERICSKKLYPKSAAINPKSAPFPKAKRLLRRNRRSDRENWPTGRPSSQKGVNKHSKSESERQRRRAGWMTSGRMGMTFMPPALF
eukprot:scaffold30052_cov48-Attheya_sp.AAC.1